MEGQGDRIRLHAFQSRRLRCVCKGGVVRVGGGLFRDGTYVNLVIPRNAQLILLLCMVCWPSVGSGLCYVRLGKGGWVVFCGTTGRRVFFG